MAGWTIHEGLAVALPLENLAINRVSGASILVARRNFGSGSSREAAVYALRDAGFQAVFAPSFGDIFAGNAVNNGLLPARLEEEQVEELIRLPGEDGLRARIDLEECTISAGPLVFRFSIDPVWRVKLMKGWDDIDLTADKAAEIARFREARRLSEPWAILPAATG